MAILKRKSHFLLLGLALWMVSKKECLLQGPKTMIERMCAKAGGTLHASASGILPYSEKQITTSAAKEKLKKRSMVSTVESDDLFIIM